MISKRKKKASSQRPSTPEPKDDLDEELLDRIVGGTPEPKRDKTDPWSRPMTDHDQPVGGRARGPGKKPA